MPRWKPHRAQFITGRPIPVESRPMIRRLSIVSVLILLAPTGPGAGAADPPTPEQAALDPLGEVAGWYQSIASLEQGETSPGEVLFRDSVNRTSRQALELTFEYARAEAARAAGSPGRATAVMGFPGRRAKDRQIHVDQTPTSG